MDLPIREEDGQFVVEFPGGVVERCDTNEQAKALSEAWRVIQAQHLTQRQVHAVLDQLARVGINEHSFIARQVKTRLEGAEKPWI